MAHAFVDAVANTGADAIKFQTHIASEESTEREPWRVKFSYQDETRLDYWRRMEFTEEQWVELAKHARERNLVMISSAFSAKAVELLIRVGMPAWKIASGEVGNRPLLELMASTDAPLLISTGMASFEEIDSAVGNAKALGAEHAVFQTTSAYPTTPDQVGLNLIPLLRARYDCPVGLSDHSGTIFPGVAANALGLDLLEVHVALSREMFGPDVSSSVTTSELKKLVEGVRFVEQALASPVDKDAFAQLMEPLRSTFFKSIVAAKDLAAGEVISSENIAFKKPGDGLRPDQIDRILGLTLTKPVRSDQPLRLEDLK